MMVAKEGSHALFHDAIRAGVLRAPQLIVVCDGKKNT
jgi:hypothetical protein